MSDRLRILIVDDEEIVHETIGGYLEQLGHLVEHAPDGPAGLERIAETDFDLTLLDVRMPEVSGLDIMPRMHAERPEQLVVIITGHGTMDMAIQALRAGATDFLTKPIKLQELDAVLEKSRRLRELNRDRRRLRQTIGFMQSVQYRSNNRSSMVGKSRATEGVRLQIELAVKASCDTILLSGETGTGKEVVARELHFMGGSDDSPFIAVSCPAIPESLVESELFGHVKGAFTGAADDRAGCFELADGGTLFLDEIADLSAAAQAKILRVLETRHVRRVGGSRETPVNVRVVAATNVPLEELVESKRFRSDLFYRLNVFTITLKPLRERPDDIVLLAKHFLARFIADRGFEIAGFTAEAEAALRRYDYPGNCRELRNFVERAAILRGSGRVDAADLGLPDNTVPHESTVPPPAVEHERRRIELALERARWNRREAAKLLEMPYSTLRYKIQKFGIG
jgi:DNA-binding NtrC family response regulator